jgi:hypothetical protein
MKIQAGQVTQYNNPDDGTLLLAVPWSITNDDGSMLLDGTQSFPFDATGDDIKAFLSQRLTVYKQDVELSEQAAKHQAEIDRANAVAQEISGLVITE